MDGLVNQGRDVILGQYTVNGGAGERNERFALPFGAQAEDQVGDFLFVKRADDGVGDVRVVAQQLLHLVVGGGGGHYGPFQQTTPLPVGCAVGGGVRNHVQGVEAVPVAFRLDGDAQVDELFGGGRVAHRNQNPFLGEIFFRILRGVRGFGQGDVPGAALGGERGDGARN